MKDKELMEGFDMEKVKAKDKLNKILSVRITHKDFEWIKKNRVSATKMFNYFLHKIQSNVENGK